ncbi:MAG: GFA family protein, partial [Hyphomicrobiaceae bacterium]
MTDSNHSARCLCGGVRFNASLKSSEVAVCHCGMCRRWSGGTFMCVEFEGALDIDPDSEPHLGVFQSSGWGERGFCRTCGSSLFWRMQDGSFGAVSVQAIEHTGEASLTTEM